MIWYCNTMVLQDASVHEILENGHMVERVLEGLSSTLVGKKIFFKGREQGRISFQGKMGRGHVLCAPVPSYSCGHARLALRHACMHAMG